MQPLPHRYTTSVSGAPAGVIAVCAADLPEIATEAPAEFGGPGDRWSPESLLCASVADCFVLTFRALAKAAQLEWTRLDAQVEGVLDRAAGVTQFTHFVTRATLTAPPASDAAVAHALLEKAEARCLVANSLKATRELAAEIVRAS